MLEAYEYLRHIDWSSRSRLLRAAALTVVNKGWQRLAFGGDGSASGRNAIREDGRVERKAYALGTLEALHEAMKAAGSS